MGCGGGGAGGGCDCFRAQVIESWHFVGLGNPFLHGLPMVTSLQRPVSLEIIVPLLPVALSDLGELVLDELEVLLVVYGSK